ncbi:MAG TPA: hypothetical protein VKG05_00390 [Steroidobacteraceae bacterium]|nr:hypothetical protein [Steroidobacteraceae bacterium]
MEAIDAAVADWFDTNIHEDLGTAGPPIFAARVISCSRAARLGE